MREVATSLSIQASTIASVVSPAYDCVIATDNRSPAFASAVDRLLEARSGGNVVDLCAVPVISDTLNDLPGTYHMGSPLMKSLIDEANARLGNLVAPLTESISRSVSDLCVLMELAMQRNRNICDAAIARVRELIPLSDLRYAFIAGSRASGDPRPE